jgi:hypothetical protein
MNYGSVNMCVVCFEIVEFTNEHIDHKMWICSNCSGVIHQECIVSWKNQFITEYTCPLCRQKYSLDKVTLNKQLDICNRCHKCLRITIVGGYLIITAVIIIIIFQVLYMTNLYIINGL